MAIYALVRFQDTPPAPTSLAPARRTAPVYPLIFVVVADAFCHLWRARRRRPRACDAGLADGPAQPCPTLAPPFPSGAGQPVAGDWSQFTPRVLLHPVGRGAPRRSPRRTWSCGLHSEALGWRAAYEHLMRGALVPMPEGAEAVLAEVGQALVQAAPPRTPRSCRASGTRSAPVRMARSLPWQAARDEAAWLVVERQGSWPSTAGELNGAVLEALEPAVARSLRPFGPRCGAPPDYVLGSAGPADPACRSFCGAEEAWPEASGGASGEGPGRAGDPTRRFVPRGRCPRTPSWRASRLAGRGPGAPLPEAPRLGGPD